MGLGVGNHCFIRLRFRIFDVLEAKLVAVVVAVIVLVFVLGRVDSARRRRLRGPRPELHQTTDRKNSALISINLTGVNPTLRQLGKKFLLKSWKLKFETNSNTFKLGKNKSLRLREC